MSKTHWVAALVPCDAVTYKIDWRRTAFMLADTNTAKRKHFYKSLLDIPWLPPTLRYAVMAELGLSQRGHKRGIEHARALTLQFLIKEAKARMRGEKRPRGGIHDAAITEVARNQGLTVTALKKRLERAGV